MLTLYLWIAGAAFSLAKPLIRRAIVVQIGAHRIATRTVLAPMAGITDRPFRALCRRLGAKMVVAEMFASDHRLWHQRKSVRRLIGHDEPSPRIVQIAGADPGAMADAARMCADRGAEIIDINMGCPAKKVCNLMAGSALLRDEALVGRILEAVVSASEVPVTLKIRTGWDPVHRNALSVARIAEASGVHCLAIHGRSRADQFRGTAEHETARTVSQEMTIPVIANGDIVSPEQAKKVLDESGCEAVMVGRAALGNPWILRQIDHYLESGKLLAPPDAAQLAAAIREHLDDIYHHYGTETGVRIARKHLKWYYQRLPNGDSHWQQVSRVDSIDRQQALVARCLAEMEALSNSALAA